MAIDESFHQGSVNPTAAPAQEKEGVTTSTVNLDDEINSQPKNHVRESTINPPASEEAETSNNSLAQTDDPADNAEAQKEMLDEAAAQGISKTTDKATQESSKDQLSSNAGPSKVDAAGQAGLTSHQATPSLSHEHISLSSDDTSLSKRASTGLVTDSFDDSLPPKKSTKKSAQCAQMAEDNNIELPLLSQLQMVETKPIIQSKENTSLNLALSF